MEKTISDFAEIVSLETKFGQIETTGEFRSALIELLTWLIDHNFEKLLWILYRIDVDEEKLKKILAENSPDEAPEILADLIIARELQKQKLKEEMKQHEAEDHTDDDLRW